MKLAVNPLRSASDIGVRISRIGRKSLLDGEVRSILRAMFRDRGLIVIEDVEPDDALQVAVSEVFGTVKDYSVGPRSLCATGANPKIAMMATEPDGGTIVEIDGERLAGWLPWHFDQCYNQKPNRGRVLRCKQGVSAGGLTGFLDGVQLYQNLSPELRDLVEGLVVQYRMNMALENFHHGAPERFRVVESAGGRPRALDLDGLPTASHPAVRILSSGARLLHVSPWMATGIRGHEKEAGRAILDRIGREITVLGGSIAYYHRWRATDLVIWDNMRMLHSATGFSPAVGRIMCRTTIMAD